MQAQADKVDEVIEAILNRPEHQWFEAEQKKRDKTARNMQKLLKQVARELDDSPVQSENSDGNRLETTNQKMIDGK